MKICSDDHAEIVYNESWCPACELMEEKEKLEDRINSLNDHIEDLQYEISELKEKENEV